MTSLGHAFGHVTNTEKMQRFPSKLLYRDFFHWFDILNLVLITLCIDFASFLKRQILREFQNIKKLVIFWKKAWLWKRNPERVEYDVFTLKAHQMFSVDSTPEKFENATNTGHFGFMFEKNAVREITWLS